MLTGGICRPASFELSGPIAENTLDGYHLDLAIVGVDGIDAIAGCTTHDDIEARLSQLLLVMRAQRAIVVVDRSKIGRIAFARICSLAAVQVLVTDEAANVDAGRRSASCRSGRCAGIGARLCRGSICQTRFPGAFLPIL